MSPCCTKDVMQYYYFALEWFFLHWYVCTCGVKLPVFFLLQKRLSETCFSIFGYNARSMRNNRLIARGSNTSNTFCRDKTYLGVEVTTRMGIDWNIYLIINERWCKLQTKHTLVLSWPIKNYILTYSYLWLIINVTLVAEGIDYAIIITTLKH